MKLSGYLTLATIAISSLLGLSAMSGSGQDKVVIRSPDQHTRIELSSQSLTQPRSPNARAKPAESSAGLTVPYVIMCRRGILLAGEAKLDPNSGQPIHDSKGHLIDSRTGEPVLCP